jgi:hypothetical protein
MKKNNISSAMKKERFSIFVKITIFLIKGLIILDPGRGVLADFWVPNSIDSFFFDFVKPLKI